MSLLWCMGSDEAWVDLALGLTAETSMLCYHCPLLGWLRFRGPCADHLPLLSEHAWHSELCCRLSACQIPNVKQLGNAMEIPSGQSLQFTIKMLLDRSFTVLFYCWMFSYVKIVFNNFRLWSFMYFFSVDVMIFSLNCTIWVQVSRTMFCQCSVWQYAVCFYGNIHVCFLDDWLSFCLHVYRLPGLISLTPLRKRNEL